MDKVHQPRLILTPKKMKPNASQFYISLLVFLVFTALSLVTVVVLASGGSWDLLKSDIGISAMHMQLLHNDRVIIFDRTDFGKSNITLPNGKCRRDPLEQALKVDCTAHSVEYNVLTNAFRPLMVLTDTWCSSGTVAPNGCLIQTGGFNDGDRAVRTFCPCNDNNCDWQEDNQGLGIRRWYATNQILPDGRSIVIGGRAQFNYEFHPKTGGGAGPLIQLPLLAQTIDVPQENNLYPFVHLNVDGNLFIFSNNRAILFDYNRGTVVKNYPQMPGGEPRNYPSTGSSVLLPLKASIPVPEVMICGGAPKESFDQATKKNVFVKALSTCGRIKINDASPTWYMETMPMPRVMGDMVLLPSTDVLITNGAQAGLAGWERAQEPVRNPLLYTPDAASGTRFKIQQPSNIPRMYHSTAILLRDGRVLVGGSNPHVTYKFTGVQYPTQLSLEAFSPDYLKPVFANLRPKIASSGLVINYGKQFALRFTMGKLGGADILVTMVAPSFTTHSYSMNQRLLVLKSGQVTKIGGGVYEVSVAGPASSSWAPPGYYMVFVVNEGIPSEGIWVRVM